MNDLRVIAYPYYVQRTLGWADTLGMDPSQVPRIYNTWVTFLSQELAF